MNTPAVQWCSPVQARPGPPEGLPVEGAESAHPTFGSSAALSSDGSAALIGGPGAEAAWAFARPPTAVTGGGSSVTQPPQTGSGGAGASSGQGVLSSQQRKAPAVPDAKLASTSVGVNRSGLAIVRVSCPTGVASCTGTVVLRTLEATGATAPRRSTNRRAAVVTLARGSFAVAGGRVKAVTLHMSKKARLLLARAHVLRARATVAAHDSAGATHTARTIVTLRAIKPARKHRNS